MNWRILLGAAALMVGLAACGEDSPAGPADLVCSETETMCGGACAETATDPRHCGGCDVVCGAEEVCSDGACATRCPVGQTACDGGCFTLDDSSENCGSCGNACPAAAICTAGACQTVCPDGQSACDSGCETLGTSAGNCGACGNACAAGEICAEGTCQAECPAGQNECDGGCFNLGTSTAHCGACGTTCGGDEVCVDGTCAIACAAGLEACDGSCVDIQTDRGNCGACRNACSSDQVCIDGSCELLCAPGLTECDRSCRDLNADAGNCGACGTTCAASESCEAGVCVPVCNSFASTVCNGQCTNTDVDPQNCGGCGAACSRGEVCDAGMCTAFCAATKTDCDGGCTSTMDDPSHCGACGSTCVGTTNANPVCLGGSCGNVCQAGFADCNYDLADATTDGCETATTSDALNCGGCGVICSAPNNAAAACYGSTCGLGQCAPGFGNCDLSEANGCEADFDSNPLHCGGCDNACPAGQGCLAGVCAPTPPGDECGNPIVLTDGANLINWQGKNTPDYFTSAPSCGSGYGPTGTDVVLRYDATATETMELFIPKPGSTRWHFVISDTCGSLGSPLLCMSDWSPPQITGTFSAVAGTSYFIHVVDTTSGTLPLSNPFEISVAPVACTGFSGSAGALWPANGSTAETRDPDLRVVFNAPVNTTTGTVTVTGNMGTNLSFPLSGTAVTFESLDRVMVVDPGVTFPSGEQLTVSLTGLAETKCSGPVASPTWSFTSPDCTTMPPATLVSMSPANGTVATTTVPELVATFDRPLTATAGSITLTGSLGTIQTYPFSDAAVTVSADGRTVTVRAGSFIPNEQVTVTWSGVTDSFCSNPVPAPTWSFTIPTPPCAPGMGGMVGANITRVPSTVIGSLTEYYVAADTDPNGYVYVGGTGDLFRMRKDGNGPSQDVGLLAGLTSSHLGYTMVVDGPNIYTVESTTSAVTSGLVHRISSDGGATWDVQDAATFASQPNDDIRGAAAHGGRIYMITEEFSAGTEIWSFDGSSPLPATATLDLTFGGADYQYCQGLAVDAAYFYTNCRLQRNTSQYAQIAVNRSTGAVTELATEFDGNITAMGIHVNDVDGDGIADFVYAAADDEEGYAVCNPAGAPYPMLHFDFGTGTGNYGLGFDRVANTLWAWDDDTSELIKVD